MMGRIIALMVSYVWFLIILIAPGFAAAGALWIKLRMKGEQRRKSPLARKICRYPGFTLSKELEDLNDKVSMNLMLLFLTPAVTMASVGFLFKKGPDVVGGVMLGFVYVGGITFAIVLLLKLAEEVRRKRAGLIGEQIVGYQLAELYRSGFYVFHDFPIDHGNIDHVVVGPPGVFAIETKYRRKPKEEKEGYKISFDSFEIRFPDVTTGEPIEQAARQAKALRSQLADILGKLPVKPVLVYPGWWVNQGPQDAFVQVINDTYLLSWLPKQPSRLNDDTVLRIARRLEDKCRDVEV